VAKKEQESKQESKQESTKAAQRDRGAKTPRAGSAPVAPGAPVGGGGAASEDGASGRTDGKARQPREAYVPRLTEKYAKEVAPALMKEFGYSNPMQTPQVRKVVLNIGMGGEARENAKALDNAVGDVATITGQKAVITRAKKSIASFKLRTGMPIGVMVTLRGNRMYDFLDRLLNVALARVRDFSGVSPSSFDGHGNFSLGLREQLIFPEIDYDKIDRIRGMEVVIVTSAKNDQEGRRLLELMGMPFKRQG
jgi:large subunit ribosomal protein L5